MAKYRITIETMEGEAFEGENTVELENFVLFGAPTVKEDGVDSTVMIHGVTMTELAQHIAADSTLLPAAIMAKGMYESFKASKDMKRTEKLAGILGGLINDD